MYERSQEQLQRSEVENSRLYQQIDNASAVSKATVSSRQTRKRKSDKMTLDTDAAAASAIIFKQFPIMATSFPVPEDQTATNTTDVQDHTMQNCVLQLSEVLQGQRSTSCQSLAYHLVSTTENISATVTRAADTVCHTGDDGIDEFRSNLTVAYRAVSLVLKGVLKLSALPQAGSVQGRVTYAVAQLFEVLLDTVDRLSSLQAQHLSKNKPKTRSTTTYTQDDSPSLELVTTLVGSCIGELDTSQEAHAAIYEGIAYFVLERSGRDLHVAVFKSGRGGCLESEIEDTRREISNSAQSYGNKHDQERFAVAAPTMLHLLRCLMEAAPPHMMNNCFASKLKKPTSRMPSKDLLTVLARERLQNTLVKCFDGVRNTGQEDLFEECLTRPLPPSASIVRPKAKNLNVNEWFFAEMWNLLGWDVLAKDCAA